jgi:hypothetical protein
MTSPATPLPSAARARSSGSAAALAFAVLALVACGSTVPVPKSGPHVDEEPILVPYPPPPARVEVIPAPPANVKGAVWIDGEWLWKGSRWVWQGGQWQAPYPDGYYAPPATLRLADGSLVYFAGAWKTGTQKQVGERAKALEEKKKQPEKPQEPDPSKKENEGPRQFDRPPEQDPTKPKPND